MPNHCTNNLHIWGDEKQLDEFINRITVGENEYRIAQLIPMPAVLEGTISPSYDSPDPSPVWSMWLENGTINQERYDELVIEKREAYEKGERAFAETGYRDWYSWAYNNYGTKWGDYDHSHFHRDGDRLEIRYETAWGPFEDSFWERVSLMFPGLDFIIVYEEGGMDFAGVHKFSAGKKVYEDHHGALSEALPDVDWDDDDSIDRYDQAKCDFLDQLYLEAEDETNWSALG